MTSKIWVNDEVAGRAARLEFSTDGGTKVVLVASAWEKK